MGNERFTLVEAGEADLRDISEVFARAMSWEPIAVELNKFMPLEEQVEVVMVREHPRLVVASELGAIKTWKVVSEEGYVVSC